MLLYAEAVGGVGLSRLWRLWLRLRGDVSGGAAKGDLTSGEGEGHGLLGCL